MVVRSFFTINQGRTFGAPGLTALAVNSEAGRERMRGMSGRGWPAVGGRGSPGVPPLRGGSFAASFGRKPYGAATAAHRGPVTGRLRSPPYPAAAPASTMARPSRSRQVRQSPGRCHSRRAGTPRIVRVGPSSVKGTRRSFLTASQKRSSGPALERRRPLPTQRA